MSRLLEELKGQTATVLVSGVGFEYEILDIDEDWVKLSRENKKKEKETKLVRIEDIQGIQLQGGESHDFKKSTERAEGA